MNRKHLQHRVFFVTPEEGDGGGKPADQPEPEKEQEQPKSDDKPEPEGDLPPEVLRKELTSARSEAAKYRTQLRDAQEALGKAKSVTEYEAAVADYSAKVEKLEADLARANAISKYKIEDPDLVAELQNLPADRVESIAKVLAKHTADGGTSNLRGGMNPDDEPETFDPRKTAAAIRSKRYSR